MRSILQQVADGDQAAIERCIDEYGGLVWGLALRYLRSDQADAEDAVQEVFVAIWMSAARFDPDRGSEAAFVATIAHRRLMDFRRRLVSRSGEVGLAAVVEGAEPTKPAMEDVAKLGEDFAKLPEDERTSLWMAVSRGLSHRQIAAATAVPVGTVKSRLRRAVMRLQAAWGLGQDAAVEGRA